jgi:hypothetical protein
MIKTKTEAENPQQMVPQPGYETSYDKLRFVELQSKFRLSQHIRVIECQLVEANLAVANGDSVELLMNKVNTTLAMITSMKTVAEVYNAAYEAALNGDFDWNYVKDELKARFCRRSVLEAEYERLLRLLTFDKPSDVDIFLSKVNEAYTFFFF